MTARITPDQCLRLWCRYYACQPFRDVITINVDTLAARYEQIIALLEQITCAGYQVKVQWECEIDDADMETPELLGHPTVCQSPMCTLDALYGGRTKALHLHYKARDVRLSSMWI